MQTDGERLRGIQTCRAESRAAPGPQGGQVLTHSHTRERKVGLSEVREVREGG